MMKSRILKTLFNKPSCIAFVFSVYVLLVFLCYAFFSHLDNKNTGDISNNHIDLQRLPIKVSKETINIGIFQVDTNDSPSPMRIMAAALRKYRSHPYFKMEWGDRQGYYQVLYNRRTHQLKMGSADLTKLDTTRIYYPVTDALIFTRATQRSNQYGSNFNLPMSLLRPHQTPRSTKTEISGGHLNLIGK